MRVSEQQIIEWTENPVTLALRDLVFQELDRITSASQTDNLVRGEPILTQENLIESATKELEWTAFLEFLEGDWQDLEIDDDDYEIEAEFP